MKKNLVKMAAVAAVAMFAQVAGAQSFVGRMKAEVPFAFEAGRASLPAGTYVLTMAPSPGGANLVTIGNMATNKSTHFVAPGPFRVDRLDVQPAVTFSCVADKCLLTSVRVLNKEHGTGAKHKMTSAERERLYSIQLTPAKGWTAE